MAVYPSKISVFVFGFAIGVIIAFITAVSRSNVASHKPAKLFDKIILRDINNNSYDMWGNRVGYVKYKVNFDYFSYSGNDSLHNMLEFQLLKSKTNILCVMFVKNVNNAYAAMNTWMKHCDNIKFYSSTQTDIYLKLTLIRPKNSWHYLCEVLRHLNSIVNDYMWVIFVPDDIYVIPENLRYYVFGKNFEDPFYLGQPAFMWNVYYNLAQAGYVLSKGSVKVLLNKFPSQKSCEQSGKYWKNEDYYLGKHLSDLGIIPVDTRDQFGRGRFHSFTPAQLMAPGDVEVLSKYWKTTVFPAVQGGHCCSPYTITFQGTDESHMYFYYYLLYNLHVHSGPGHLGNVKSRTFTPSEEIWQQFVMDELGSHVNLSAITLDKYYELWYKKIDSPSTFNQKLRDLLLGSSDK